jgi:hypothetical protein
MANEHSSDDAIEIWQSQHVEPLTMSIEELRSRAMKFESQIRLRNRRETIVAGVMIPIFALFLRWFPSPLERAGSILIIAGILFVIYRMNSMAAPAGVPAGGGLETCVAFHRRELERQRDLLRSIAFWYLGPLVPGLVLFNLAVIAPHIRPGHPTDWWRALPFLAIAAAWFRFTIRLNRRAAHTLQRAIDDLARQA